MTSSATVDKPFGELVRLRVALSLICLVNGACVAAWAALIPSIKEAFALNEVQLGSLIVFLGIGALVTMPVSGWAVNRWGCRTLVAIAGVLHCVALALIPFALRVELVALSLLLLGITDGLVAVALNTEVVRAEKLSGRALMSSVHAFFNLGGIVGAGGISLLLKTSWPLPASVLVFCVLASVVFVSQSLPLQGAQEATPVDGEEKAGRFRLNSTVMLIGLLCFVALLSEGAVMDWSAVYLQTVRGFDASAAVLGYACFSAAMLAGRFSGDYFRNRYGAVAVLRCGAGLAALGFLVAVWPGWSMGGLPGFFLVGLGTANILPVLYSAAGHLPGMKAQQILPVVTAIGLVGLLSGPAVLGFVAHATNLSIALAGVAVLLVGLMLAAKIVLKNENVTEK